MHEWALAEAVIATVERLYEENGRKQVLAVHVRIGELQRIDLEVFREGLQRRLDGRPFPLEIFDIQIEQAEFRCRRCGRQWLLAEQTQLGEEELEAIHFLPEAAHVYMRCPGCQSPDYSLERGRGVRIHSVDLHDEGPIGSDD
jgi:hydrogenase nickel incorporation protein HypA/HybF